MKSVLEMEDYLVELECLMVIPHFKIHKKDSNESIDLYHKTNKKLLAQYRYDSMLKNGKLKKEISEKEMKFYIKDLELSNLNMFK